MIKIVSGSAFQQAVVRNVNDKNAQLQKQLENVVREANGEINILNNKVAELERDLELERRKVRELHDASRERDKEYQKLKAQHDKIKRKALLVPDNGGSNGVSLGFASDANPGPFAQNTNRPINIGAVVGDMRANGIQRTPLMARNGGGTFLSQNQGPPINGWVQSGGTQPQRRPLHQAGYRSGTASDRSESASEIENMLMVGNTSARRDGGWGLADQQRKKVNPNTMQRVFAPASIKRGFRPATIQR